MKKRTKAIIRSLLIALVALILGVNIYSLNASRLAGNAVPMPFGVGASVVLSGSMEPSLSVGDLIIISAQEDYALQQVIVYQDGASAVVHRIVAIDTEANTVTTRGDANDIEDDPIPAERIKGKVILSIPLLGYLVNLIKSPIGTIVILALAVLLLERSFRKEKEQDAKQLDRIREEIEKLKQQAEHPKQ